MKWKDGKEKEKFLEKRCGKVENEVVEVGKDKIMEKWIIGIGKVLRENIEKRRRDNEKIELKIKGDGGLNRIIDIVEEIESWDEIEDMKIKRKNVNGGKMIGDDLK